MVGSADRSEAVMVFERTTPLATLLDACSYYVRRKKQRLTFEYILIEGVNDHLAQAEILAKRARAMEAKVNLDAAGGLEVGRAVLSAPSATRTPPDLGGPVRTPRPTKH